MNLRQRLAGGLFAAAFTFLPAVCGAALIGGDPQDPKIDFGGAGITSYDAATGIVTISGIPATLLRSDPFLFGSIVGTGPDDERLFTIQFRVDAAGNFVGGVDGPDLKVTGGVDVDFDGIADYQGTLLEAEVTHFGFQNSALGNTDIFDLRLQISGGSLAPLYTSPDLAAQIFSEESSEFSTPFNGSFATSFSGPAKGVLGSITPPVVVACQMAVEAFCSVDNGPYKSKCRISHFKSPKYWDYEDRVCHGVSYRRYVYGLHGSSEPAWSRNRPHEATSVKFKYVVRNTGTTPISALMADDSFDTDVTGLPASLAVGQTAVTYRTEDLRESVDNTVLVSGSHAGLQCTATDTVVIRERLRERRRHDADRFKDKGRDDDHQLR